MSDLRRPATPCVHSSFLQEWLVLQFQRSLNVIGRGYRLLRERGPLAVLSRFSRALSRRLTTQGALEARWLSYYSAWRAEENKLTKVLERRFVATIKHQERRIRTTIRFRRWLGLERRIHVIFLAQIPVVWHSISSLYEAVRRDPRFFPIVIGVKTKIDFTGSSEEGYEDRITEFLTSQGVPVVSDTDTDLSRFLPDVIFVPTPYDEQRPEGYHTITLKQFARLAYVPYGLDVGAHQELLFNGILHNNCWRIFSRSVGHKAMHAKYTEIGDRHVVVSGHPKLDAYSEDTSTDPQLSLREPREGWQLRLIWAPHFDVRADGKGWSTFLEYVELFFRLAEEHPRLAIAVRPHPFLFRALVQHKLLSEEQVECLQKRWETSPNMTLHTGPNYFSLFKWSDALMTDCSSFLFEYIPRKAPVLYLENPAGPGMNEEGNLVESYYRATKEADILQFVSLMLRGSDPLRDRREATQAAALHVPPGGAGRAICDYLAWEFGRD